MTPAHVQRVIGVIGLGAMGRPIANALLSAGYTVVVHDVCPDAVDRVVKDGARAAASSREVATHSDLVITMLPRADDVLEAVLGKEGVVHGLRDGATILDTSTIDVGTIHRLAAALPDGRAQLLDGGVSGSPAMAWARTVTLMVSGDHGTFQEHRPILEALCAKLIYGGRLGSAKVMKLANNQVAAVTIAALSEAFALLIHAGVDPNAAWEAMSSSWAASAMLGQRPPLAGLVPGSPADQEYQGAFSIDYMIKDLDAVLATATQVGARHPTASLARSLFAEASERGDGALDVAGLYRTIAASDRT